MALPTHLQTGSATLLFKGLEIASSPGGGLCRGETCWGLRGFRAKGFVARGVLELGEGRGG